MADVVLPMVFVARPLLVPNNTVPRPSPVPALTVTALTVASGLRRTRARRPPVARLMRAGRLAAPVLPHASGPAARCCGGTRTPLR